MFHGTPDHAIGGPAAREPAVLAWQAATIDERLAVVRGAHGAGGDPDGRGRLADWARAVEPSGGGGFERRLAWDGIDGRTARLALQDVPPCALPPGWPPQQWTAWLPRVLDEALRCARRLDTPEWDGEHAALRSEPSMPFAEAFVPWLVVARGALDGGARWEFARSLLSGTAMQALDRHLVRSLAAVAAPALYEHFDANRSAAAAERAGSYRLFVRALLGGSWLEVCATWPVLARQLVRLSEDWVDSTLELADRLRTDQPSIEKAFGMPAGRVTAIRPGLSDRHDGGRSVAMLQFAGGLRVAYKPRGLGLEAAFHGLLGWFRDRGLESVPAPLRVLDCGTHGWVEWVEQVSLPSPAAAADYFRRAGGLVCLVHVAGGADLHGENVVASHEGPSLVDAEMLLQPVAGSTPANAAEAGEAEQSGGPPSCLAPGLVSLVQIDADGLACDVGGLQPSPRRTSAVGRRVWIDPQGDGIHVATERTVAPVLGNDVRVGGVIQPPGAYVREICDGFERAHRFLVGHRDALLAADGPLQAFTTADVRVLFRPSDQYGTLQYLLAAPRYQRSGIDRSLAFERLVRVFAAERVRPRLWPLVADEREALERLDIPRFSTGAAATGLVAASGARVTGFFGASGLDAARQRLAALDDDGLRLHLDELRASLQPAVMAWPTGAATPPLAGDDLLVRAAEFVGRLVVGRAEPSERGLAWPSCRGAVDLYGGASGPALFLAALSAVTGSGSWRQRAMAALSGLVDDGGEGGSSGTALGACRGTPSLAYALAAAGELLGEPRALDRAVDLLAGIPPGAIESDAVLDVEGGCAGLLMVLLAIHARRPDVRLAGHIDRAIARLLDTQVRGGDADGAWPAGADARPRAGFAHGAAGIACALERSLASRPGTLVAAAIRRAWGYERRVFLESGGAWPTVRADGSRLVMAAWCHGAPGIALARATGGGSAADELVEHEVDTALSLTAAAPRGRFDHLCCGLLGRADVLLTAARATGRVPLAERGRSLAEMVARQILDQGRHAVRGHGFDRGATVVGFFQGLSGIGYQLLRAAAPERLPSGLSFAALPGRGGMMQTSADFTVDDLRPGDAGTCGALTFPAYRHLLALAPSPRLPSEPAQRLVQPLGVVARQGAEVVGLALAEAPMNRAEGSPELLSLFVLPAHRGRGVATRLVEAVEERVRRAGFPLVEASYMTGKPSIAAVERVLAKRGWEAPALRTFSVKFTLKEAVSTPWYGRVGLPRGADLFSWVDLTADERRRLFESNERSPWIPNGLQPWRHDAMGFDPVSSLGLRYRGEVVGWMINHRMDERTVRFTCSFMRPDLSRRARILPLYSEAIRRLYEAGCEFGTFVTPTVYPGMVEFIHQHIKPYVTFTGETRGTRKSL